MKFQLRHETEPEPVEFEPGDWENLGSRMQGMREQRLRKLRLTIHGEQARNDLLEQLIRLFEPAEEACYPIGISYRNRQASAEILLDRKLYMPLHDNNLRELRQVLGQDAVQLIF